MSNNKKAARLDTGTASNTAIDTRHSTAPQVTGQCAEVLKHIRNAGPVLSFVLIADHAIPETAARVHDLRCMRFNILMTIKQVVEFRDITRRNVALYSLGTPAWPRPGFFAEDVRP